MHLTVKMPLKLNEIMEHTIISYGEEMKKEIVRIADVFTEQGKVFKYPYKEISNTISWNSKGIVLQQAKLLYESRKSKKNVQITWSSLWSNLSYHICEDYILLELGLKKYRQNFKIAFYAHEQQVKRLKQGKCKDMMITRHYNHWYAYINVEFKNIKYVESVKKMGIDVGVKNPAVVYTQDGKVKFFGNGRERSYVQRRYRKHIQKMQELNQINKLVDFEHKLHRKLTYYDHKISKEIIDFAKINEIGIIVMEALSSMNKSFDIKIKKDIYLWSYRRIQLFVAYKAKLEGIEIKYVNPKNTSKRCPICGKINRARDRLYMCNCGFRSHRDIVGARNIMLAL